MLIYNYNPITFEYTSSEEAYRNPLDEENPIIPSCATKVRPPECVNGYAIVWVGNRWDLKEDHRGELWFNKNKMSLEVINFIGSLNKKIYASVDSPIANKPDGDYWKFDNDENKWVGDAYEYKKYIQEIFNSYWDIKLNTPFIFNEHKYLPSWRELYTSIYVSLSFGIKDKYVLQDYDGFNVEVDKYLMKDLMIKLSNIVDEMYIDKHNLEEYFEKQDNFSKLEKYFNNWVDKKYE